MGRRLSLAEGQKEKDEREKKGKKGSRCGKRPGGSGNDGRDAHTQFPRKPRGTIGRDNEQRGNHQTARRGQITLETSVCLPKRERAICLRSTGRFSEGNLKCCRAPCRSSGMPPAQTNTGGVSGSLLAFSSAFWCLWCLRPSLPKTSVWQVPCSRASAVGPPPPIRFRGRR